METKDIYIPSSRMLIYSLIAETGSLTKAELQNKTLIKSSTLTRILDEMVEQRLLQAAELGPSRGGRRPILYQIRPDYGYIFGLEVSRIHSCLGLFDMQLNLKSVIHWRMDEAMTPERFKEYTLRQMRIFLRDHQIPPEKIVGLGIGAVGPLNRSTGTILNPQYFPAEGWSNIPICQWFEEKMGFRTVLENGVNSALIGEQWSFRHENIQHVLYVHAGVSLRSAMMSHGRIIHGAMDMEDSIGQMIIQTDGIRLNSSGNYGALEAYASIEALEKKAQTQAKMGRLILRQQKEMMPGQINFEVLLKALKSSDPFAVELFTQSASYFGIGLANLINIFQPEKVILGGALIHSNSIYYKTAIEIATSNTCYDSQYKPQFSKGQLMENAVVTGAALHLRNTIEL